MTPHYQSLPLKKTLDVKLRHCVVPNPLFLFFLSFFSIQTVKLRVSVDRKPCVDGTDHPPNLGSSSLSCSSMQALPFWKVFVKQFLWR